MSNYRISSDVNPYTDKYINHAHAYDHEREYEREHEREIAQRLYQVELAIKELQTRELIGSNFLIRSLKIFCYNVVGILLVIGAYTVLQYLWELYLSIR